MQELLTQITNDRNVVLKPPEDSQSIQRTGLFAMAGNTSVLLMQIYEIVAAKTNKTYV
jgi:hypothetical protein